MEKRKSTTTIITLLLLLVFSLPALAVQALTTTQMRENTIRINALEIKNMDITNIEAPKEMTIVLAFTASALLLESPMLYWLLPIESVCPSIVNS